MVAYLPVSALLAPQNGSPTALLPSPSAAVLGPLPPTTRLHLALNWIALSDLPEYDTGVSGLEKEHTLQAAGHRSTAGPSRSQRRRKGKEGRVLVITGSKDEYHRSVEEDDEDWIRRYGGSYQVLASLKRVDMRYCPTPRHLLLLLNLLAADRDSHTVQTLERPPGLVILWDIGSLLMEDIAGNENEPVHAVSADVTMAENNTLRPDPLKRSFKQGTTISTYLDLIAAARSAVEHLGDVNEGNSPAQLVVLEPHIDPESTLPIIAPATATEGDAPSSTPAKHLPSTPTKSRRIAIADGLKWLLGQESLVAVKEIPQMGVEDDGVPRPTHTVRIVSGDADSYDVRRRRCGRGEWASAASAEEEVEGDKGGWRWEWI